MAETREVIRALNTSDQFIKTTDGDGKAPWGGNFGFVTPFADACVKLVPDSGMPTGSILPKP